MAKFRIEYEVVYTGHVIVEAKSETEAQEIFDDRMTNAKHKFDIPQPRDEAHVSANNVEPASIGDETELR